MKRLIVDGEVTILYVSQSLSVVTDDNTATDSIAQISKHPATGAEFWDDFEDLSCSGGSSKSRFMFSRLVLNQNHRDFAR